MHPLTALTLVGATLALPSCSASRLSQPADVRHRAFAETVENFAALVPPAPPRTAATPDVALERVSAGVPWPRGLAFVDDELVVLARGRHRRAGGVDATVPDRCGTLLRVDPGISEPVVPGILASDPVAANAGLFAAPEGPPFLLWDPATPPIEDTMMDRPYCTLLYDEASRNLFVCGYSGVDLPGGKFRKNATDSIHRFDLRTGRWSPVELHRPEGITVEGRVVSNEHYPHHDPARNPAPHGLLNGPNGGCVAGDYLYCVGKDNHVVARYDLRALRANPEAGPPPSRVVLGPRVRIRHPGGERTMEVLGPSAAEVHDGHLYLGYRTSSVVLRFALDADGDLAEPPVGELIAVFEPWDPERGKSANLIDIAFDSSGALFVSCARRGRIWRVGVPDPARPFYGDDHDARPTSAPPWVDLRSVLGKKTACGNIAFDDRDRLYLCGGAYDTGTDLAGVVYRVVAR